MKRNNSKLQLDRALKSIPLATQTFSKSYKYYTYPVFIDSGSGGHVTDVDGNEYIDYILGLGPITLGYNYPVVDDAIRRQLITRGIIFSQPSPLETGLAEVITRIIPGADMVRFLKTGSEACQASVRIARAYTGRDKIASFGYHGWHSEFAVKTERPKGIPEEFGKYIELFEYNNIEQLENILKNRDIACVIMEPVIATPPFPHYLEQVKRLCHDYGSIFILDEVVTGFRWARGGASEYFGVVPDLVCLGKGMANGMPISAIAGRRDLMQVMDWDSPVFISSTFGGECLSLAASLATIYEMLSNKTIDHCWELGKLFTAGLSVLGIKWQGYECRPYIQIGDDPIYKSKFLEQLMERGVMIHIGGLVNFCFSHTRGDIDNTLNAIEDVLGIIDKVELKGDVAVPAFKRL